MDRKLPGVFQTSFNIFFLLLAGFVTATFFLGETGRILAFIEIGVIVVLALYVRVSTRSRSKRLWEFLDSMTEGLEYSIKETPLPVLVFNCDTNEVVWSNEKFMTVASSTDTIANTLVTDIVPDFTTDWLRTGKSTCPDYIEIDERLYLIYGISAQTEKAHLATTYWVDVTEFLSFNKLYNETRPIHAIILIDNYDELVKGMSEKDKSFLISNIDEIIEKNVNEYSGYLCKFDRDRYFLYFHEKHLDLLIEDNFSVLDIVREQIGADGLHATLSIGFGKDGAEPAQNARYANLALEMALSRGGDQAVIRNQNGFEFYGGHAPQLEKRTKVKSRVMATAFGELLAESSVVFIMGHKIADFDTVGAAIGISCIARSKGVPAKIVVDFDNNAARSLIEFITELPEYWEVFISEQDAIIKADNQSLLVIVDTNRPDIVESSSLLLSCSRIAVIDHHRRAADYIDNAVLNFHEITASSSSELVTEMMQYIVDGKDILKDEASALLTGIVLDTKGFSINTGIGTFDAASFLRRAGADAAVVKKVMQTDIDTATSRYDIMRNAKIYADGVVIATTEETQTRVSVAQAADELLNIMGVHTTFAAARNGNDVFVSGRSIGGLNVQIILEKLGGGGSREIAGLQVYNSTISDVTDNLKKSIDSYIQEDELRHAMERR